MPFTLAHPAIVLPLVNSKRVSTTALIIGTMIPDFKFYLQLKENIYSENTSFSFLCIDLSLAIFFSYLFHNLLKKPLLANLPILWSDKFKASQTNQWNQYAASNKIVIIFSALLGVMTHIVWDGFTHHDGFFVTLIDVLNYKIHFNSYDLPIYFLLQILFSILGLAILFNFIYKKKFIQEVSFKHLSSYSYWIYFLIIFIILLAMRLMLLPQYNTFWSIVIAIIGCALYAWTLNSIIFIKKTNV
jgi:hypothetical protein